jgi:anaerobic selenocysteine-containing dehydrogenase
VRNGGAQLLIVNSRAIRLRQQAAQFLHIRPGTEDAAVLALVNQAHNKLAASRMGLEEIDLINLRRALTNTEGDLVVMFGGELSLAAQSVVAQLPYTFAAGNRRVLLHPLPLYNNSIGVHDVGLMRGPVSAAEMLITAGERLRAMYVAGSFLPPHLEASGDAFSKLDFLVVQELFETDTTRHADVVLPAASFAESDGTFTNNDGFVQRIRQSIPPVHQAKQDWMITTLLAKGLGHDFGFQMSASAVFQEVAANVPAYSGMRYPLLKDETKPVQAQYGVAERRDLTKELESISAAVEKMPETGEKVSGTPEVGHELFKPGTLTGKVPQFHLLAAGNPEPPTHAISPLYQISIDPNLRRPVEAAGVAGD